MIQVPQSHMEQYRLIQLIPQGLNTIAQTYPFVPKIPNLQIPLWKVLDLGRGNLSHSKVAPASRWKVVPKSCLSC
jgi:hypothetical protein